jgi:hypothetical protein
MRALKRSAVVAVIVISALVAMGTALRSVSARPTSLPTGCRSDPSAGVHDPQRLTLLAACTEVVGTVIKVPHTPPDGDHTFNVKVDPAYVSLLNAQNRADGGIHVEIVPMDQPACTAKKAIAKPAGYNNLGVCSGAGLATPPLGARVRVVGAYVHDTWSGPNEIHPAWLVETLAASSPPVTTMQTPTVTQPVTTAPHLSARLQANLTGAGIAGHRGSAAGHAHLVLTLSYAKVCWRFSTLRNVAAPTRARIGAGAPGHPGRLALSLGAHYARRGCASADTDAVLEPMIERPSLFYATLASSHYPRGAIRGQLTRIR